MKRSFGSRVTPHIVTGMFCLAAAMGTFMSHADARTRIGTTVKAELLVSGNNGRILTRNSDIFSGERIVSTLTGFAHFRFNDGTKLVVGPNTRLTLDELVYSSNETGFVKFALTSAAGALRVISGDSDSSAYEIQTPVSVLGIRGTAFDLRHYRGRTYVMVLDGEVELCGSSGSCETIKRRCEYVVAGRNGQVSDPRLPKTGIFEARDMRRFFPFVNNQSRIEPDFQLPVNPCSGGNGASSQNDGSGSDGPSGDNGSSNGSSASSGSSPSGMSGGSYGGGTGSPGSSPGGSSQGGGTGSPGSSPGRGGATSGGSNT
ncbi:MAG: FecR domain-containing protein [Pseudomonadota bacterium]